MTITLTKDKKYFRLKSLKTRKNGSSGRLSCCLSSISDYQRNGCNSELKEALMFFYPYTFPILPRPNPCRSHLQPTRGGQGLAAHGDGQRRTAEKGTPHHVQQAHGWEDHLRPNRMARHERPGQDDTKDEQAAAEDPDGDGYALRGQLQPHPAQLPSVNQARN